MAGLGTWALSDALEVEKPPKLSTVTATVKRVDDDGTAWVTLGDGAGEFPATGNTAEVKPGDRVSVRIQDGTATIGGNVSDPSAGITRVMLVENLARDTAEESARTAQAVVDAQQTADEAQKVAEATNQHFFADTNGAHITDVTQDEWAQAVEDEFSDYDPTTKPYHNQLLNSLGILLRTALNNLVSITRSAIAFYDGAGNAASNIVARFGSAGAQIGKSTGQHVTIDQDSLDIMNGGTTLATFGETASIGRKRVADSMCISLGSDSGGNVGITEIRRWINDSSSYPYFRAVHDANNGNDYVVLGVSNGTYPGYGSRSVALGSFSSQLSGAHGDYSVAEGVNSYAGGDASHAQNTGTKASSDNQTAIGKFNVEDANDTDALIIGNGTADNARSNAFAVTWGGAADLSHTLTVETFTQAYTAAANSLSGAITIDISKTGYTPLGVVGFACGSSGAAMEQAIINGNTATMYIRNVTSSAISRDCTINVLYMAVV